MALVNLGGGESEDLSAALQTINENFEKIKISYRELYEQNLQGKSTQIIELHQIRHLNKALRAGELLGFGLQLHLLITQALNQIMFEKQSQLNLIAENIEEFERKLNELHSLKDGVPFCNLNYSCT